MVGDAQDVAGEGFFGDLAVLRQEADRVVQRHQRARTHVGELHAAAKMARAQAHEGDPVAVLGVHVGLHLEDEGRHFVFAREHLAFARFLDARRRRQLCYAAQKLAHSEIVDGAAEKYRRHVTAAVFVQVEGRTESARHPDLFAQRLGGALGQHLVELRIVEAVTHLAFVADAMLHALHQGQAIAPQVVAAQEALAHADRPAHRRDLQLQRLLDLIHQLERLAPFAVELVDEGDDGHVAQPAHLEQFSRLLFDTLGGVEHHDRRVDGRQRTVRIFTEVLVAGGIDQVEHAAVVLEGHGRCRDRDAALAFDFHPIRAGAPRVTARLDGAGQLDGAAEE